MKLAGYFEFDLLRAGVILESRTVQNLVVDGGVAAVAGLIIHTGSTSPFQYIGIGVSTQAASSSDAGLYSELTTGGGNRALATLSRVTTTITNDTAQLVKTFTFTTTGTYAVSEAGIFNAVTTSSGTMLCRQTFTPISVVGTDTLQVTYKLPLTP